MITINDCSEAKVKEIADKKAIKVDLEDELVETQARHAEVLRELEELAAYNVELHKSCDFVLKNFEVRQTARDQDEIKHKDFCTDELNTNLLQTEKKESEKADLIAKTNDLGCVSRITCSLILEWISGNLVEKRTCTRTTTRSSGWTWHETRWRPSW